MMARQSCLVQVIYLCAHLAGSLEKEMPFTVVTKHCLLLICPGNHTISVVKCKEDYDTLRTSLQNVIREINSLSKEKVLEVDGKQLKIHPYLGGDYKVNKSRHN